MRRFVSVPQMIDAVQWTGDNLQEIVEFDCPFDLIGDPLDPEPVEEEDFQLEILAGMNGAQGWVPVPVGHWIVRSKGDKSDHWPVDPDYFEEKYEEVPVYTEWNNNE